MRRIEKYQAIWLLLSAAILLAIAVATIHRPVWGDERHTVETIQLFGISPWPQIIFNYPEVTPPLFFVLYATWGKIFGFDLIPLRIFSLLVAFAVFSMVNKTAFEFLQDAKTTFFASVCFLLNPYVFGLSGFVFTDMLTLLFVLCAIYFFKKNRIEVAAIFTAFGMLCRQYVLFLALAFWITTLIKDLTDKTHRSRFRFSLSMVISSLPLCACIILWKGFAPPMGIARWIVPGEYLWNPHAFTTYIVFTGIYFLPVLVFTWKKSTGEWKLFLCAMVFGLMTFMFPVQASFATLTQTAYNTVGLVHRAIDMITGHGIFESFIFYAAACVGFWIVLVFISQDIAAIKNKILRPHNVLSFCIYFFLLIMPFSYQVWEKYLVLILWAVAIRWFVVFAEPALVHQDSVANAVVVQA